LCRLLAADLNCRDPTTRLQMVATDPRSVTGNLSIPQNFPRNCPKGLRDGDLVR
jgi:hypothetical protein